jgi:hypothetical protein
MTNNDQEERQAAALERRWQRGIVTMVAVFLVVLGLFWAGVYLLTQ